MHSFVYMIIYLYIYSYIHLFICSFIHLFMHLLVYFLRLFIYSYIYLFMFFYIWFIYLSVYLFIDIFMYLCIGMFIHLFIYRLIYWFIYWFILLFIYSCVCVCVYVCVCVCVHVCVCYRPPVRLVCTNHDVVVFQPQKVTAPDWGSVANITTILALPPHLFQPCYVYSFPPHPGPISYRFPIFYPLTTVISLFAIDPPPPCLGADRPYTWTAHPYVGLHRSSALPSHDRRTKEFLVRACDCLP